MKRNTQPIILTEGVYVQVMGYVTGQPDYRDGELHNQWVVIVVQRESSDKDVVVAWHPNRASARKQARKLAKVLMCKVREIGI